MMVRLTTLTLTLLLAACDPGPAHLQPSGYAVRSPQFQMPFEDYLAVTRQQVDNALRKMAFRGEEPSPFGEDYSVDRVAQMRSPYQLDTRMRCQPGQLVEGYLLIHGLSDSPYLLSAVARNLADTRSCALIRAVLLPGHGTAPGDSTLISREEWRDVTRYGVQSFDNQVDSLHLVGYSAGATLAVDYLVNEAGTNQINGLVLLSPALGLPGSTVWLSPYLRWFARWLGIEGEHDAAKYESFSIHAGAEFYLLIRSLRWRSLSALDIPVLMVVSGDDATVDVLAAGEFFCDKALAEGSQLIWYQGYASAAAAPRCAGVTVRDAKFPEFRVASLSHVGLTMPANDPHYGLDARYRQCLHYRRDSEQWSQCQSEDLTTVYGERSLLDTEGKVGGALLRRATFNPDFEAVADRIQCFVERRCQER